MCGVIERGELPHVFGLHDAPKTSTVDQISLRHTIEQCWERDPVRRPLASEAYHVISRPSPMPQTGVSALMERDVDAQPIGQFFLLWFKATRYPSFNIDFRATFHQTIRVAAVGMTSIAPNSGLPLKRANVDEMMIMTMV